MAAAGSVFSATLQEITNTKLKELSTRRVAFEEAKASVLASIRAEDNAVERLAILSDGVKRAFDIKRDKSGKVIAKMTKYERLEIELKHLDRFLDQAKCDPSVSDKMLANWEQSLLRHLEMQSLKFQYASLDGELVTEWLSGDRANESDVEDAMDTDDPFQLVSEAKKLESRMEWEKTVFEPADVDQVQLKQYLHQLFGAKDDEKKSARLALEGLRKAVSGFESELAALDRFSVLTLKWVIRGLHSSELLSDEKREVLSDFENNEIVLREIADVLNMRLGALSSWTWNSGAAVPVEMRRKISGVYNIHMHEDLLQAIFLHYIGVRWSVFFKRAFRDFRKAEGAWKSRHQATPKADKLRMGYYLGELETSPSLQDTRAAIYHKRYFVAQLLDFEEQDVEHAEGEEEAEYDEFVRGSAKRKSGRTKQTARKIGGSIRASQPSGKGGQGLGTGGGMRHRKILVEDEDKDGFEHEDEGRNLRSPMKLKQFLLRMLSTEININTRLNGEMTAFHSVFDSWNSLLPHETVLAVLQYLGVSGQWLDFFKNFLEAPLKFVDDDASVLAKRRRRGTPAAHTLSDVFGETTLFCLDFAINQSVDGNTIWRIQDDFWFWSRDHSLAVKAWETVAQFLSVTGTQINGARTGTVRISRNKDETLPIDKKLPPGEIRWGFLRLSPQSGQFEIDQNMVDSHIEELQKQLYRKRKSVLSLIQAWNTYATTFFTSNFGKPANCFGRQHVDSMLATHEHIERQVFLKLSENDGEKISSVAEYLKKMLFERFGILDVPDGYLYFPMELGGLDLQSSFVSLLQIREDLVERPADLMEKFEVAEREAYERHREVFESDRMHTRRYGLRDPYWEPDSAHDRQHFMSYEEYTRYREEFDFPEHDSDVQLHDIFVKMMKLPEEQSLDPDASLDKWLGELAGQANLRGITSSWGSMEPYWRWVTVMFGSEIVERFGGLNVVDAGLLPMGMVTLFRDKRITW